MPWVTRVSEDTSAGTAILQVKAIDGDHGLNVPIRYALSGGGAHTDHFTMDAVDGTVYLTERVDREDVQLSNSAVVMTVTASEASGRNVTTQISVLILDVNDQRPTFADATYRAVIDENSPLNMPVTFLADGSGSPARPTVFDYDLAANGTFELSIRCEDGDLFDVSPTLVVNEAEFGVRVRNQSALDYERIQVVDCVVTARELLVVAERKSSSVRLSIAVRDVNDNVPQFSLDAYHVLDRISFTLSLLFY